MLGPLKRRRDPGRQRAMLDHRHRAKMQSVDPDAQNKTKHPSLLQTMTPANPYDFRAYRNRSGTKSATFVVLSWDPATAQIANHWRRKQLAPRRLGTRKQNGLESQPAIGAWTTPLR